MKLPIKVSLSTVPTTTATAIRYGMTVLGGFLIARGWVDHGLWEAITALAITGGPLVYGVYLAARNHNQKKILADYAPNDVAVTK